MRYPFFLFLRQILISNSSYRRKRFPRASRIYFLSWRTVVISPHRLPATPINKRSGLKPRSVLTVSCPIYSANYSRSPNPRKMFPPPPMKTAEKVLKNRPFLTSQMRSSRNNPRHRRVQLTWIEQALLSYTGCLDKSFYSLP